MRSGNASLRCVELECHVSRRLSGMRVTQRARCRAAWCRAAWLRGVALLCAAVGGGCDSNKTPPITARDAGKPVAPAYDAGNAFEDAGSFEFDIDGGLAAAQACDKHSDCSLVQSRCACLYLERADVTAFNRRFQDLVTLPVCTQRCRTLPSPYLIPTCQARTCQAIDIRAHAVSECQSVADCALRVRECCECAGNAATDAVIALPRANFAAYEALVCDDPSPVCDACLPSYPATNGLGLIAHMSCRDGHCAVEALRVEPQ
jgi:hypothetical protein